MGFSRMLERFSAARLSKRPTNVGKMEDKKDVSGLTKASRNPDLNVRVLAVRALARVGGKKVVAPLIRALDDSARDVREDAAKALVDVGKPAVKPLISALVKPDGWVRLEAAWALGRLGDRSAGDPLKAALEKGTTTMRGEVVLTEALADWASAPTRGVL